MRNEHQPATPDVWWTTLTTERRWQIMRWLTEHGDGPDQLPGQLELGEVVTGRIPWD